MRRNFRNKLAGCMLSLSLYIPTAMAQSVTGSITGEATDPTGAVVVGAQVVARGTPISVNIPLEKYRIETALLTIF